MVQHLGRKLSRLKNAKNMEFNEVTSQEGTSISSYGDGGFRIGEQRTLGSILITPNGYYPWNVSEASAITLDSLSSVTALRQDVDILLIGTGDNMCFLTKDLRSALEGLNISVDVMATGSAARTYNILLAEGRKVAAAMIAVD